MKIHQSLHLKQETTSEFDSSIDENKESKNTGVDLYYYSGFSEPEKIESIESLFLESNYLGNVTDEFMEEYEFHMKDGDIADFQENQFVASYGVWVNPTKEQLQEYNKSVMLDDNEYLQDFEGHEQLYRNRHSKSIENNVERE